jgi:hypothetical protein
VGIQGLAHIGFGQKLQNPRQIFLNLTLRRAAHTALADRGAHHHAIGMFVVPEADAAAIRAVFCQEGELSAAIELRRRFPGITDNAKARECARSIAEWAQSSRVR